MVTGPAVVSAYCLSVSRSVPSVVCLAGSEHYTTGSDCSVAGSEPRLAGSELHLAGSRRASVVRRRRVSVAAPRTPLSGGRRSPHTGCHPRPVPAPSFRLVPHCSGNFLRGPRSHAAGKRRAARGIQVPRPGCRRRTPFTVQRAAGRPARHRPESRPPGGSGGL